MTTRNPIDVDIDARQCVALVDLENIRLSWERSYNTSFQYSDLVTLLKLTEALTECEISRLSVFATLPSELRVYRTLIVAHKAGVRMPPGLFPEECHFNQALPGAMARITPAQLAYIENKLVEGGGELSGVESNEQIVSELQNDVIQGEALEKQVLRMPATARHPPNTQLPRNGKAQAVRPTIRGAGDSDATSESDAEPPRKRRRGRDADVAPCIESDDSLASQSSQSDSEVVLVREENVEQTEERILGLHRRSGHNPPRIAVKLFGFKSAKGRLVQKGCDVMLGAELTKACFDPHVEIIILFSADADFQELVQQSLVSEDVGGITKFAKTCWVAGFRDAFANRGRLANQPVVRLADHINYICIDRAFPQLKPSPSRRIEEKAAAERTRQMKLEALRLAHKKDKKANKPSQKPSQKPETTRKKHKHRHRDRDESISSVPPPPPPRLDLQRAAIRAGPKSLIVVSTGDKDTLAPQADSKWKQQLARDLFVCNAKASLASFIGTDTRKKKLKKFLGASTNTSLL